MNGISDEKTRNFRNEIIILEKQGSTINEHDLYAIFLIQFNEFSVPIESIIP